MLRFLRSSLLEKFVKSNIKLLLLSDKLIEKFKFLLPYEKDWYYFKKYKISKNSIIIDIGAHWGESAITFNKFYPENKIVSFEPNNNAFQRLKKNTKKLNIDLFNYGIGKQGVYDLYFPYYKNHQLSLWGSQDLKKLKKRIKQYTYLDNKKIKFKKLKFNFKKLPNFNNKIEIIKIDVEGQEFNVVKILRNIIKKNKPLLFIEHNINNFDKIYSYLKQQSYKSFYYSGKTLKKISRKVDFKNLLSTKKKMTVNIIFKI